MSPLTPQEPDEPGQPPAHIVDLAIEVSGWSPCRSKRGVVIFSGENVVAHGHNHKPRGFDCDQTDACKATCRREAVHAEQQALVSAGRQADGAEMLHVKTVSGKLVASGGPSCVECSKLARVCGIAGVWLYHDSGWRRYPIVEFHQRSLLASPSAGASAPAPLEPVRAFDYIALEVGEPSKCLVCGLIKPWGIMDGQTRVTVCVDCRDAGSAAKAALDAIAQKREPPYIQIGVVKFYPIEQAPASAPPSSSSEALIAISEFCRHKEGCPQRYGPNRCTCGLANAQEKLITALTPASAPPEGIAAQLASRLDGEVYWTIAPSAPEQRKVVRESAEVLRALSSQLAASQKEIAQARALLSPVCDKETLCGAIRNLQQAYLSEHGNAEETEAQIVASKRREAALREERDELKLTVAVVNDKLDRAIAQMRAALASPDPEKEPTP